ncbi:MAG: outer membrane beta-barrel protein [Acidobacteriota bacterium]
MKRAIMALIGLTAALPAPAQWGKSWHPRHHFETGLGFAVPGKDLTTFYQSAFAWGFGYGYRPWKYFQIDLGYQGAYNAARVKDYIYNPSAGYLRIRDFQTYLPLGARVVAPVGGGRVEFYGGGGASYVRTAESLRQPNQWVRFECPDCVSRDGWGYYAMLGTGIALTQSQAVRLTAITRVYRAETSGPPIGANPAIFTREQWVNTTFGLTFSF